MVLTGQSLYLYWGWNETWKGGSVGSDKHIPFNPTVGVPIPKVKSIYDMQSTAQALYPNIQWATKKEGEEVTITSYYRDPFLWCQFFSDVTVTTAWLLTGNSDGNQIIGTLGDRSEEAYMWMQIHVHDKDAANHYDLFFDGGVITKYRIEFAAGEPVKEVISILFATVDETETAANIDVGFDDGAFDRSGINGGWSNWDGAFDITQVLHTSDLTIEWGGIAIADIAIVSGSIEFTRKHILEYLANSTTAGITFENPNETPYTMEVTGFLEDDDNLAEALLEIGSKTTGTAKISYNTDCFWQFTNAVIKDYDIGEVTGSAVEITMVFEGSANSVPSAQWDNLEGTDPSLMINHVSP